MSHHRTSPSSGYCDPSRLPRGPNGRGLCRQCSTEVPRGRRTFCGETCIDAWMVKTSPQHVRRKLLERDRGVCALCGLDCVATKRELTQLMREMSRSHLQRLGFGDPDGRIQYLSPDWICPTLDRYCPVGGKPFFVRCIEIGLKKPWRGGSLWQADHIVPVVEGGGECGLEGFRTLCLGCHARETAALAKRRAEKRRADRASMRGEPSGHSKGESNEEVSEAEEHKAGPDR